MTAAQKAAEAYRPMMDSFEFRHCVSRLLGRDPSLSGTLEEMALFLGVDRRTAMRWATGQIAPVNPTAATLLRYMVNADVSIADVQVMQAPLVERQPRPIDWRG